MTWRVESRACLPPLLLSMRLLRNRAAIVAGLFLIPFFPFRAIYNPLLLYIATNFIWYSARRMKSNENSIYLVLHNIRSVENVGSIFRTADAVGIEKIFFVGYTPTPIDRFGRARQNLAKSALGAEKTVPWEKCDPWSECSEKLRVLRASIIAVEQAHDAIDYRSFAHGEMSDRANAFVFGNEVEGIPQDILDEADAVLEIPMYGKKESLNVSVAVGVILYGTLSASV
jgi:23S rRNA (guanosine2251-2'-O)-methyltransferase